MELIIPREIWSSIPSCIIKTALCSPLFADGKQMPDKGCKTLLRLPPPLKNPLCIFPLFCCETTSPCIKHVKSLAQGQRHKLTPSLEMHFDLSLVSAYSSINSSLHVIPPLNPTAVDLVGYPSSLQSLPPFYHFPYHTYYSREAHVRERVFLPKPIIRNSFLYNVSGRFYCPRKGYTTWSDWREDILFHSLNRGFSLSPLRHTQGSCWPSSCNHQGSLGQIQATKEIGVERNRTMELMP